MFLAHLVSGIPAGNMIPSTASSTASSTVTLSTTDCSDNNIKRDIGIIYQTKHVLTDNTGTFCVSIF